MELNTPRLIPEANGESDLPEWLILIPAGKKIQGRDGRQYYNNDSKSILRNQKNRGLDLPVDIQHATEGWGSAPAVGWIMGFKEADGAILGKVEWNDSGRGAIEDKHYRYYSPVYVIDEVREIQHVRSVGLTNMPNLVVPALNEEQENENNENNEGENMEKFPEWLLSTLQLNSDANESDVKAAFDARFKTVQPAESNGMVPGADYQVVLNRAEKAEAELNRQKIEDWKARAEKAVGEAVKDGKVAPASRDYHLGHCSSEEGLKNFEEFVKSAPRVIDANAASVTKGVPGAGGGELNEEEKAVAGQLGFSDEKARKVFGKK